MKEVKFQNDQALLSESWVNAYSDQLYSWCLYKINSKEIAEDLVQDTFMAAFQSMKKYERKSEPKTWLFSILNNKIADHFRKKYRNPTVTECEIKQSSDSSFFGTFFDDHGSWLQEQRPGKWPEEDIHLLDDKIFLKVLQSCMAKLSSGCNTAVQLKYLEDKKGDIICQELKVSSANFWQLLHRARLQLRKCLEMNWFKK